MAEFKTHVGLADSDAGNHGATTPPGNEPRPTPGAKLTPGAPGARPAASAGFDKQAKGAGQGGGEVFDNFTPNTEAVLPEPSIAEGLEAAQDEMTRGTEQAQADPDKGAGTGPATDKASGANKGTPLSNGTWVALGLAALVIGALILRPGRRRA